MNRRALLGGLILQFAFAASALAGDSRREFLALLDRPRVPLAVQANEIPTTQPSNGLAQHHFSYAADAQQRVPGILVKLWPVSGRRPAVIVLHGTGGERMGQLSLLRELANRGFIAVAIDARYHGERTTAGKGSDEYQRAIVRAWLEPIDAQREHPFYYDSVWDVMRLIDYLQTRDDVDPQRIGVIGFSKGGIEAYLAAAVDPRIAVAAPCIGVQSFGWALENDAWQPRIGTIKQAFDRIVAHAGIEKPDAAFVRRFYERVVPGIYDRFDGPAMLPLIAPRPLLVINGDSDDRTPLPGLKLCTDAAQRAYRDAGAEDRFVVRIQEKTGHKVSPEAQREAVEWFVRWLKP
jgi:dienelactone hydrolase